MNCVMEPQLQHVDYVLSAPPISSLTSPVVYSYQPLDIGSTRVQQWAFWCNYEDTVTMARH